MPVKPWHSSNERCYVSCYWFSCLIFCELMKENKRVMVTSQHNIKFALGGDTIY